MATEMEQFAVDITLGMKASFYMKIIRSKCVKGAEVYRNRGEAVEKIAYVSDIVKRSPAGENKAIIEFNKWRQSLYIKCGDKLKETHRQILAESSTLQQVEEDRANDTHNDNNNNNNSTYKRKTAPSAVVTGGTPATRIHNNKRRKTQPKETIQKQSRREKKITQQQNRNNKNNNHNTNNNNNNSINDDDTLTQSSNNTRQRSTTTKEGKRLQQINRRLWKKAETEENRTTKSKTKQHDITKK
jgi:hypothetical protein